MNQNNQQAAAAAEQEKPATSAAQQAVNSEPQTSAATAASAAAEQSAEKADKKPAKADKTKQDSAAPRLVPFQMVSQLNRSRLSAVGKADDKTLGQLLDAWEKSRDLADNADTSTGKLLNQIRQLKQTNSAFEQTIADLKHKNSDLHQQLDAAGAGHYSAPDEFLSAFEPIVAELLQRTADKMTDIRTDGLKVVPSMIVGDMFLKYTLQKRTMWFYKWILSDAEILEIAQNINPNITSIRMLRKILNVDKELN